MADAGGVAVDQLRAFVECIERLEEEKAILADDIKDVYAEAKGNGFDVKVMCKIVSLRKRKPHEREEEEAILGLYLDALGMTEPMNFIPLPEGNYINLTHPASSRITWRTLGIVLGRVAACTI